MCYYIVTTVLWVCYIVVLTLFKLKYNWNGSNWKLLFIHLFVIYEKLQLTICAFIYTSFFLISSTQINIAHHYCTLYYNHVYPFSCYNIYVTYVTNTQCYELWIESQTRLHGVPCLFKIQPSAIKIIAWLHIQFT